MRRLGELEEHARVAGERKGGDVQKPGGGGSADNGGERRSQQEGLVGRPDAVCAAMTGGVGGGRPHRSRDAAAAMPCAASAFATAPSWRTATAPPRAFLGSRNGGATGARVGAASGCAGEGGAPGACGGAEAAGAAAAAAAAEAREARQAASPSAATSCGCVSTCAGHRRSLPSLKVCAGDGRARPGMRARVGALGPQRQRGGALHQKAQAPLLGRQQRPERSLVLGPVLDRRDNLRRGEMVARVAHGLGGRHCATKREAAPRQRKDAAGLSAQERREEKGRP